MKELITMEVGDQLPIPQIKTPDDFASLLGVQVATVLDWHHKGLLGGERDGYGYYSIRFSDRLDAFPEIRQQIFNILISRILRSDIHPFHTINLLGDLVDISASICSLHGLNHCEKVGKTLEITDLDSSLQITLHSFLANAANAKWNMALSQGLIHPFTWEIPSIEDEIIHLRHAILCDSFLSLTPIRRCQIFTNLGNALSFVGRIPEAIEQWNSALKLLPDFPMALGNKGQGLRSYALSLHDDGHTKLMLKVAHSLLVNSLKQPLYMTAKTGFEDCRGWIESVLPQDFLDAQIDLDNYSLGDSQQEMDYRRWVLDNCLFVNPLNDIMSNTLAAADVLITPPMFVKTFAFPSFQSFFCHMKQEFVSARFLCYSGLHADQVHFSDKHVTLINTPDRTTFCLALENVKSAYRMAYSLLDKIAYFLNLYFELNIPTNELGFRTIWYSREDNCLRLRSAFAETENWPLRGLFWLSKDMFQNAKGFRQALLPDASDLQTMRNHLEHKYLKVHDLNRIPPINDSLLQKQFSDTIAFSLPRPLFCERTVRLLKIARSALIYLALSLHARETQKQNALEEQGLIVPIQLQPFPDEWKR